MKSLEEVIATVPEGYGWLIRNDWYNWFENSISTEYMIYPVNDGRHKDYPQQTPKARVLAYLADVLTGKQKTIYELMDEYMEQRA
jgi:hypothetical protein